MLPSMILIAAALAEELETALNLCGHRRKIRCGGVPAWTGVRGGKKLHFLKLGVGPVRSAQALESALQSLKVASILLVGYGGALDPELKQGELVIVERADLLSEECRGAPLTEIGLGGSWPLAGAEELFSAARAAGLPAHRGVGLTSPCVIGAPEHKRLLFARFNAAIVDMETAALARVASNSGIPLSCVRAVSDEAQDDFLAFLSYDPAARMLQRAAKTLTAGNWMRRYHQWRERSKAARENLSRFLVCYFDRSVP